MPGAHQDGSSNGDAGSGGWVTTDLVTRTTTKLTTTGGTVWPSSTVCLDYLQSTAHEIGLNRPGVRVLELGSGCGQLGLILVRNLPHAAEVCLTEQAFGGALEHLQTNVIANRGLPNMGSVSCCACDWTHVMLPSVMQAAAAAAAAARGSDAVEQQQDAPHSAGGISQQELLDLHKLLTTRWDVVVGSDLIYNEAGARALPRVLATLMRHAGDTTKQQQQPVCYYAHTKHRYDSMDELLFQQLAAEGLTAEEVVQPGKPLPPPSPPLYTQGLFPEMRVAVFKIQRQPTESDDAQQP